VRRLALVALLAALGGDATAAPAKAAGTTITVRGSEFGSMLWGPKRQAIYTYQRDRRNSSRCYGRCAEAWPPVFTSAKPVAGPGVRKSLLGTARRRNGRRRQTALLLRARRTRPGPLPHVDLNGGLWWVVGPDGKRLP
jgi:predicted lipoprotein with Yx(FWY)xxD motif